MTVELRPEMEALVQKQLATGAFSSAEEVIERALQILSEEADWLAARRNEVSSGIQLGWRKPKEES